ncbi:hypothetical protein BDP27DRAFT_1453577 [Rhodocollybia butyracea]|uniref:Methyltransferase type 11 domain-containing protein n=1 Tax=Rhodocollybia butyracea TaxID=206335 RepID=A0A9P5P9G0_9AGAR|nr:hypothetical protein BDP27DRAFT_1453577 [Rhodocollybia butyracea]
MAVNSPHTEERPFVSHYILKSHTEEERERLDWQNQHLTQVLCDGQLIYVPKFSLDPGDEILDSAAGTAKYLPPHSFSYWYRYQSTSLPHPIPQNVTFAVHTVTNLPESWSSKFSLVNQRLIFGALTHEQWGMALSELYRILKPGGWIQLLESGPETSISSGSMKRYADAFATAFVNSGLVLNLTETLGQRLEHAGFVNIQKRTTALPRLDSQDVDFEFKGQKRLIMASIPTLKPAFLATGMFESEDEIDALHKGIDEEWNAPSQFRWHYTVAYAQKPDI